MLRNMYMFECGKKLDVLKKLGYIVQKQGNVYDFYEVPMGKTRF